MSELTLLLLQIGFLILLWFFVFAVVYSLRADLFGVKVRKLPEPAAAGLAPAAASAPAQAATAPIAPAAPAAAPTPSGPQKATRDAVSRIVITSGPKAGLELPLGSEALTIGRSSESGLVIRDDYTSSHHARLLLWGDQWMIQDLDSTNGTWHDGARVSTPVPVRVGAPIKVGATTFELRK
ncbi:FHA domain-containing protein [Microbacterium hominis]|uniref:FHA domain-containing protein n=1 Tax=Microbacterium hominis TaxID=162426 RepID=A0A2K9DBL3_9MICO|nr:MULTISPECIES: FHA domain-containing protein [Microbacterium]AUG30990.1 FHA domain-containing protein [Microbacterium hominis]QOC26751.1 FHA domain-containing protein [Microbacterium hominis]QOC27928.1 FHA domain-containing protein [Microbacterium hominis]QRY39615.1 FHA domain-containing protein [Microbacterium hominis]QYF96921.1 FHA domain-containing protein [Microbacterium sp. PAMC21962]